MKFLHDSLALVNRPLLFPLPTPILGPCLNLWPCIPPMIFIITYVLLSKDTITFLSYISKELLYTHFIFKASTPPTPRSLIVHHHNPIPCFPPLGFPLSSYISPIFKYCYCLYYYCLTKCVLDTPMAIF